VNVDPNKAQVIEAELRGVTAQKISEKMAKSFFEVL
jgi:hypothetical protein